MKLKKEIQEGSDQESEDFVFMANIFDCPDFSRVLRDEVGRNLTKTPVFVSIGKKSFVEEYPSGIRYRFGL